MTTLRKEPMEALRGEEEEGEGDEELEGHVYLIIGVAGGNAKLKMGDRGNGMD